MARLSTVATHPNKSQIVKMILDNVPFHEIALAITPPVSQFAIRRFRDSSPDLIKLSKPTLPTTVTGLDGKQVALEKYVASAPPSIRARQAKLAKLIDETLDRAKKAQRMARDPETGEMVAVGSDLKVMAPLIREADRNIRLEGEITGELANAAAPTLAVQIVMQSFSTTATVPAFETRTAAGNETIDLVAADSD